MGPGPGPGASGPGLGRGARGPGLGARAGASTYFREQSRSHRRSGLPAIPHSRACFMITGVRARNVRTRAFVCTGIFFGWADRETMPVVMLHSRTRSVMCPRRPFLGVFVRQFMPAGVGCADCRPTARACNLFFQVLDSEQRRLITGGFPPCLPQSGFPRNRPNCVRQHPGIRRPQTGA